MVDISRYRAEDFEGLMFNVYGMPNDVDLIKRFPVLKFYSAFNTPLKGIGNKTGILKYVFIGFDKNSPVMTVDDVLQRRHEAALLAGIPYKRNTEVFHEEMEDILKSRNSQINLMVIQFLIMQMNDEYMTYIAYQNALYDLNQKLFTPDYTSKDISDIKLIRSEIKQLKKEMNIDTLDPFLKKSLYVFTEATRLKIAPEDYAKSIGE